MRVPSGRGSMAGGAELGEAATAAFEGAEARELASEPGAAPHPAVSNSVPTMALRNDARDVWAGRRMERPPDGRTRTGRTRAINGGPRRARPCCPLDRPCRALPRARG